MIEAYPLIYSRTKNVGFVPDFLVRPSDLDVENALKYVWDASKSLDMFDGIRYCAFSVGDYCICGGISGINKIIVNKLREKREIPDDLFAKAVEYTADSTGRNIASFIGFAIRKSDHKNGEIPDLKLFDYWKNYQKYIVNQWKKLDTKSEKLEKEMFIELSAKKYNKFLYEPVVETVRGKKIIRDFHEKTDEILEYFFDQILNKNADVSFISDVRYKSDWESLSFTHSHVADALYTALKKETVQPSLNTMNQRAIPEIKTVSSDKNSSNTDKKKSKAERKS